MGASGPWHLPMPGTAIRCLSTRLLYHSTLRQYRTSGTTIRCVSTRNLVPPHAVSVTETWYRCALSPYRICGTAVRCVSTGHLVVAVPQYAMRVADMA